MKTFITLLTLTLSVNSMATPEILCSLKKGDIRYKLVMDYSYDEDNVTFMMTASSISATQAGMQSQYAVGRQEFTMNEDQEGDSIIIDLPVKGPGFSEGFYDFTEVVMEAGGEEDLIIKIKGPAIKEGELTFENCLAAE
jgi:hypothetical protein